MSFPVVERSSAHPGPSAVSPGQPTDAAWTWLYRMGAVAAAVTALLIPISVVAHVLWPPPPWAPGAAADWFAYIQANRLAGLLNLDLGLEVGLVLSVPLWLALYVALRHRSPSGMAIATAAALLATVLHLIANTAVEMVAFSDAYTAATTDAQRAVYLAAGEAALSAYYGTVFQVSYALGYVAYILVGAVMLRSAVFGRAVAYLGIAAGVAGFGFYLPGIGLFLSVFAVLFVGGWNVLVARGLVQLGSGISRAPSHPS